jgi:hypothetical protein
MSELLREIEEDIRRERFDRLWHSFGKLMVGVSVAIILVTICVVVIQGHKQTKAMEKTSQFIKGIDRINIEDYKGAIPVFAELAGEPGSSYYGLAMLRKAQAHNGLSDHEEARKTYKALADNDPVFGALARLALGGDTAAQEPAPGSPFYHTQSESKAWSLLQQGKKDEAVAQFLALYNDPLAPYTMRERVTEVLQHMAPEKLASANAPEGITDSVKENGHE